MRRMNAIENKSAEDPTWENGSLSYISRSKFSIGRNFLARSLWIYVWLFSMCSYCFATINQQVPESVSKNTVLLLPELDLFPLNNHLYWFQTSKSISPTEALRRISEGNSTLLGSQNSITATLADDIYWLYFQLHNPNPDTKDIYFQFNNPHIDSIVVYRQTSNGWQHWVTTGAKLPFRSRLYLYHDFILPIQLDAGKVQSYLLMVKKEGKVFSLQPQLMSASFFKSKEQRLYVVFGVLLGIMLFNIVINIFLGISLRDRIHFLYAVYVFATLTWLFCSIGAEFQYIFPDYPELFSLSESITGAVTMILMGRLAFNFLQLREQKSKAKMFLQTMTLLLLLVLPVKLLFEIYLPDQEQLTGLLLYLYMLGIAGVALAIIMNAIVRIQQGFLPAWFYLFAMCYLCISILISCYLIIQHGDLSMLFSAPTHVQIGLVVETLIIFMGIIYRYNLLKKERTRLQKELAFQELEMNRQIIKAQEDERRRLAQDLHDDVGASLSTLMLHISNLPDIPVWNKETALRYNERSLAIGKKALKDLRSISHDLMPKDFKNKGLAKMLQKRMEELNNSCSITFHTAIDGDDSLLPEMRAIILYRIINELLSNAVRHSQASYVSLDLIFTDNDATLVVEDNGRGINRVKNKNGIGLHNVYSRVAYLNGRIDIDSNKKGTTVIVILPLNNLEVTCQKAQK